MTELRRKTNPLLPLLIGSVVAAIFYFGIVLGLLRMLWGPTGSLIKQGDGSLWIARVMSSPINLFSMMAFGGAIGLLLSRRKQLKKELSAFELNLMGENAEALILPGDAMKYRKRIHELEEPEQQLLLVRLLNSGLQRARANWSAEDVGVAIKSQAEIHRDLAESEYAIINYLAWAIPSIGFIGTVLGIGQAMGAIKPATAAVSHDEVKQVVISPLEEAAGYLSMAFDTTFVALTLSLLLMYLLYQVQGDEDALLARATDWCQQRLAFRMHITMES